MLQILRVSALPSDYKLNWLLISKLLDGSFNSTSCELNNITDGADDVPDNNVALCDRHLNYSIIWLLWGESGEIRMKGGNIFYIFFNCLTYSVCVFLPRFSFFSLNSFLYSALLKNYTHYYVGFCLYFASTQIQCIHYNIDSYIL